MKAGKLVRAAAAMLVSASAVVLPAGMAPAWGQRPVGAQPRAETGPGPADPRLRCMSYDLQVPTTPAPPTSAPALKRHLDLLAEAERLRAPGAVEVVAIGDSIVQGWPPDLLRQAAGTDRVLNLGIGGDRFQHVLWRLQPAKWAMLQPRRVILLLGTNNLGAGDKPCAMAAGAEAVLTRLRVLWPEAAITAVPVMPRGEAGGFRAADRAAFNALFGDMLARIPHAAPVAGLEALADRPEDFVPDRLHLSRAGYEALTAAVAAAPRP
ncbi:GDSL-type esterase/lipase family protein [Roseomonas elaeocarpi]|uniref:GDSL-type esterase/lipase family protein n=1 Tax=Roseomonas elaeocarpi TaxID=907779 RepID=A0ABV6JP14_9PROT